MRIVHLILILFTLGVFGDNTPANKNKGGKDYYTTLYGAPVPDNDHSLSVGIHGPTLLEDYTLLEKLANFDRFVVVFVSAAAN